MVNSTCKDNNNNNNDNNFLWLFVQKNERLPKKKTIYFPLKSNIQLTKNNTRVAHGANFQKGCWVVSIWKRNRKAIGEAKQNETSELEYQRT